VRVVRSGDWTAQISGDFERQIDAALGEAGRRVVTEVDREIEGIYRDAYAAWPMKTGTSRRTLTRQTVIDIRGIVRGEVRAGASYARYIQSWQIGNRPGRDSPGTTEHLRALGVGDPVRQRDIAQGIAQAAGKAASKASKSGSAMWLLLRWPEMRAAKTLTASLRPVIEAALASRLEG
jgi:hypothetical protein